MIRIIVSLILILTCSVCCHNIRQESYVFEGYYDTSLSHIKLKGRYISGKEDSIWSFYDEIGNLIKQGRFANGYRIGNWRYSEVPIIDTTIEWVLWNDSLPNYFFSLPKSYTQLIDSNKDLFVTIDSLNGSIFSIKEVKSLDIESYYSNTLKSFQSQYRLINFGKTELENTSNIKYYVIFSNILNNQNIGGFICSAYFQIEKNKLIDISYTCDISDSAVGKTIFVDIIQSCYYNNIRLASPLDKLQNSNANI